MRLAISDPIVYPVVIFTFLRFEIHLLYIEIILILIQVYNKNTFSRINFNKTTNISPGSLKIHDQTVTQLVTEILTISFLKSVAGPQEFTWDIKFVVLWSPASNYSKQMLCFVPDFVFNNNKKSSFVTLNNECCLNGK